MYYIPLRESIDKQRQTDAEQRRTEKKEYETTAEIDLEKFELIESKNAEFEVH